MSKGFVLTAQLNLTTGNINSQINNIRKQLKNVSVVVDVKLNARTNSDVKSLASNLSQLNKIIIGTKVNVDNLSASFTKLSTAFTGFKTIGATAAQTTAKVNKALGKTAKATKQASSAMEEFGHTAAFALKRYAGFVVATSVTFGFLRAITGAVTEAIKFERELVRVSQVTGTSIKQLRGLTDEITRLSTTWGVASSELIGVSRILSQAGLSATDTKIALESLAKTSLAPTFTDINRTAEGAIAIMRQFKLGVEDLDSALGSINAVASKFAVESDDIINAVRRAGGVFAASAPQFQAPQQALREFIALFTSVRATTRESAEGIATGLRTIFTRIQRGSTIRFLQELGIELEDSHGKFVGVYEAVRRLAVGLNDPALRGTQILGKVQEQLGGFRQIGKIIPLIRQMGTSTAALDVALKGQESTTTDAEKAQQALAVQLVKTREKFFALIRGVTDTTTFDALTSTVLGLAKAFIFVGEVIKPIVPLLAIVGSIKAFKGLQQFGKGVALTFKQEKTQDNTAAQVANTTALKSHGVELTTSQQKSAKVQDGLKTSISKNVTALTTNTKIIGLLTTAINKLTLRVGVGVTGLVGRRKASGGSVGFAKGGGVGGGGVGIVPGIGNTDSFHTTLSAGSFVLNKKATRRLTYGQGGELPVSLMPGEAVFDPKKVQDIGLFKLKMANQYGGGGPAMSGGGTAMSGGGRIQLKKGRRPKDVASAQDLKDYLKYGDDVLPFSLQSSSKSIIPPQQPKVNITQFNFKEFVASQPKITQKLPSTLELESLLPKQKSTIASQFDFAPFQSPSQQKPRLSAPTLTVSAAAVAQQVPTVSTTVPKAPVGALPAGGVAVSGFSTAAKSKIAHRISEKLNISLTESYKRMEKFNVALVKTDKTGKQTITTLLNRETAEKRWSQEAFKNMDEQVVRQRKINKTFTDRLGQYQPGLTRRVYNQPQPQPQQLNFRQKFGRGFSRGFGGVGSGGTGGLRNMGSSISKHIDKAILPLAIVGPMIAELIGRKTTKSAGVGGALSGATVGAVTGSFVGGGSLFGIAVGGLIGAVTGLASALNNSRLAEITERISLQLKQAEESLKEGKLEDFGSSLANILKAASKAALLEQGRYNPMEAYVRDLGNATLELPGVFWRYISGAPENQILNPKDSFNPQIPYNAAIRDASSPLQSKIFRSLQKQFETTGDLSSTRNNADLLQILATSAEAQNLLRTRLADSVPPGGNEDVDKIVRSEILTSGFTMQNQLLEKMRERTTTTDAGRQLVLDKEIEQLSIKIGNIVLDQKEEEFEKYKEGKEAAEKYMATLKNLTLSFNTIGAVAKRLQNDTNFNAKQFSAQTAVYSGGIGVSQLSNYSAVVGNRQAYDTQQFGNIIGSMFRDMGATNIPQLDELRNFATGIKQLETVLPKIVGDVAREAAIENKIDPDIAGTVGDRVRQQLPGVNEHVLTKLLDVLKTKVEQRGGNLSGLGSVSEFTQEITDLTKHLGGVGKAYEESMKALAAGLDNAFEQTRKNIELFAKSVLVANDAVRNRQVLGARQGLEMARAEGRDLNVTQLTAPLQAELRNLLQLGAGQNPFRASNVTGAADKLLGGGGILDQRKRIAGSVRAGVDEFGNPLDNKGLEYLATSSALLDTEVNELIKGFKRLVGDTSVAAASLNKIGQIEKRRQGALSLGRQMLTSTPTQLIQMQRELQAFSQALDGGVVGGQQAQLAFAGFDKIAPLLSDAQKEKINTQLIQQSNLPPEFKALIDKFAQQKQDERDKLDAFHQTQQEAAKALIDFYKRAEEENRKNIPKPFEDFTNNLSKILASVLPPNTTATEDNTKAIQQNTDQLRMINAGSPPKEPPAKGSSGVPQEKHIPAPPAPVPSKREQFPVPGKPSNIPETPLNAKTPTIPKPKFGPDQRTDRHHTPESTPGELIPLHKIPRAPDKKTGVNQSRQTSALLAQITLHMPSKREIIDFLDKNFTEPANKIREYFGEDILYRPGDKFDMSTPKPFDPSKEKRRHSATGQFPGKSIPMFTDTVEPTPQGPLKVTPITRSIIPQAIKDAAQQNDIAKAITESIDKTYNFVKPFEPAPITDSRSRGSGNRYATSPDFNYSKPKPLVGGELQRVQQDVQEAENRRKKLATEHFGPDPPDLAESMKRASATGNVFKTIIKSFEKIDDVLNKDSKVSSDNSILSRGPKTLRRPKFTYLAQQGLNISSVAKQSKLSNIPSKDKTEEYNRVLKESYKKAGIGIPQTNQFKEHPTQPQEQGLYGPQPKQFDCCKGIIYVLEKIYAYMQHCCSQKQVDKSPKQSVQREDQIENKTKNGYWSELYRRNFSQNDPNKTYFNSPKSESYPQGDTKLQPQFMSPEANKRNMQRIQREDQIENKTKNGYWSELYQRTIPQSDPNATYFNDPQDTKTLKRKPYGPINKNFSINGISQTQPDQPKLNLDTAISKEFSISLDAFGVNVGSLNTVADKLTQIPTNISMTGRHEVNVVINGATVLSELEPKIQNMVVTAIEVTMDKMFESKITGETAEQVASNARPISPQDIRNRGQGRV